MNATAESTTGRTLWLQKFWEDLQPGPGRLAGTLRIVLASVITLLLLLVWRMPFASVGLYFVFLISRDSPSLSLRSSLFSLAALVAAVFVELGVVSLTDNDPVARVLSIAIVSYLAGALLLSSSAPALGTIFGFIFCTLIGLWENHLPADDLVKTSLWIIPTVCIAMGTSIAIEYIFASRPPADQLESARRSRYQAVEHLFSLYAEEHPDPRALAAATASVSRLATAGQSGMQKLYDTIVDRNLATGSLPIGSRVRITMLAQLLDVTAAFASQHPPAGDPEFRRRCARIAEECRRLGPDAGARPEASMLRPPSSEFTLLDRVENTIYTISSMPTDTGNTSANQRLVALPSKEVSFMIPGAFTRPSTVAFGLKISFCATLCYIIYNALAWPGISTAVLTVLIAGLSTSAAIKQKLTLRFTGSLVGGLILGIGCTSLLFPHMDSITALTLVVAAVAFVAAWCAASPRFNYFGLQIAFSFYIVAFEGFSAPTELQPARDRLIGILLAVIVMWFVFDQVWPVRTVTAMRGVLAAVLRSESRLIDISDTIPSSEAQSQEVDKLRDQVGKEVAQLRTMAETVEYEFGVDRQPSRQAGATILRIALTAVALFWNHLAVLHSDRDLDFLREPRLVEMRRRIARHMNAMADAVTQRAAFVPVDPATLVDPSIYETPRYAEYARNTADRYGELQDVVGRLNASA